MYYTECNTVLRTHSIKLFIFHFFNVRMQTILIIVNNLKFTYHRVLIWCIVYLWLRCETFSRFYSLKNVFSQQYTLITQIFRSYILTSDKYIHSLYNYLIKLINQLPSELVDDSHARDTQPFLSAFETFNQWGIHLPTTLSSRANTNYILC